ncbi:MAG TPA: hypothetical protein VF812_01115 [Ktedonobacterales bacterium]
MFGQPRRTAHVAALTLLFIGGGLLLLGVGIWLGVFAHDVTPGLVLALIGALLAGTPLSRMGGVGGVSRNERRLQRWYWRTGGTPPPDTPAGMHTPFDND